MKSFVLFCHCVLLINSYTADENLRKITRISEDIDRRYSKSRDCFECSSTICYSLVSEIVRIWKQEKLALKSELNYRRKILLNYIIYIQLEHRDRSDYSRTIVIIVRDRTRPWHVTIAIYEVIAL